MSTAVAPFQNTTKSKFDSKNTHTRIFRLFYHEILSYQYFFKFL